MEEVISKLMEFIASASGASMTLAVVLEFIFRMVPTKKPLSIAHLVGKFARMIGELLLGFANLLDKILPQHIKDDSNSIKLQ